MRRLRFRRSIVAVMVAAQVAMLAMLASRPVVAASCITQVNTKAVAVNHAEHARVHGGHGGHEIGGARTTGDDGVPAALALALACCNAHAVAILPLPIFSSVSIFAGMPVSALPERLSSVAINAVDPPPRAIL